MVCHGESALRLVQSAVLTSDAHTSLHMGGGWSRYWNKTLLLRSCAMDGTLLRPDEPAVPVDRSFLEPRAATGVPPSAGGALAANVSLVHAHSDIEVSVAQGGGTATTKTIMRWHYILAASPNPQPINELVSMSDLWPLDAGAAAVANATVVTIEMNAHSQSLSATAAALYKGRPLAIKVEPLAGAPSGTVPHALYLVAPGIPTSPWLFLGEATTKLVAAASMRWRSVEYPSTSALTATAVGSPGEAITASFMHASTHAVVTKTCTIAGGHTSVTVAVDDSGVGSCT